MNNDSRATSISTSSKRGQRLGGCGAILFGLIFAGVGSAFLFFIGSMWTKEVKTRTWTKTPCMIESCEVVVKDPDNDSPFTLDVRYRYTADGQSIESTTFALQNTRSDWYEDLSLKRRKILTKPEFRFCYVNPQDPGDAVLSRGSLLGISFMLLFPLPFVAIGLFVMWTGIRTVRAKDRDGVAPISTGAKTLGDSRKFLLPFFGIFFVVGAVLTYIFFLGPLLKSNAAESWIETPCEIIWSKVRYHSGDSDSGPTYSVDIFYRYEFDGDTYHSNNFNFSRSSSSGRKGKQAIVNSYSVGSQYLCYVNPSLPEKAVLERNIRKLWIGLIPGVFMLFGLGGLIVTVRSKKSQPNSSTNAMPLRTGAAPSVEASLSNANPSGPRILRPNSSRITSFAVILGVTLFWNGIVSVFAYQVVNAWLSGDPEWFTTLFLVPFVLIGLLMILGVIHTGLALFNPRITVTLASHQSHPGETLKLSWRMEGLTNRLRRFSIAIEAEESATYRQGTNTHTDTKTFYHYVVFETSSRLEMHTGGGDCLLPTHLPPSFDSGNNKIVWKVRVLGEIPWWPDIDDNYTIEVNSIA